MRVATSHGSHTNVGAMESGRGEQVKANPWLQHKRKVSFDHRKWKNMSCEAFMEGRI